MVIVDLGFNFHFYSYSLLYMFKKISARMRNKMSPERNYYFVMIIAVSRDVRREGKKS